MHSTVIIALLQSHQAWNGPSTETQSINLRSRSPVAFSHLESGVHQSGKQKEINDICASYSEYYETVVNIYINDCKQFNTMIKAYNNTENTPLEEYQSVEINDYVDYNQDGNYLEKRD